MRFESKPAGIRPGKAVDVPAELAQALGADGSIRAAFDAMSYSHRKEYADWVGSAKKSETRVARAEKAIAMLREGKRERA